MMKPHGMPGTFIVFEGLDGSGTSTQARLLKEALEHSHSRVYLTCEPTNGPVGQVIRLAMSHRLAFSATESEDDRQLAYLFAADRFDHLHNNVDGILRQLASGAIVISTRYFLSSYAYHCRTAEDFELVRSLNMHFPFPDLTFFIDCPVEYCLERIRKRTFVSEKYEHESKLSVVKQNYELALSSYTGCFHRIDGRTDISTLSEQIHAIAAQHLCAK